MPLTHRSDPPDPPDPSGRPGGRPSAGPRDRAVPAAGQAPSGRLVLLLATACGLTVANLYYAQPLLAVLRQSLHISELTAGTLITVGQAGYAAGMILLVPLGDRVENRRLTTILLAVATAACVAAGTAPGFGVLAGALLVAGAVSVVAQILVPFAAGLAPDHLRGRVVGRVMSGLLTGILLSRTLSSLITDAAGWRAVYLLSAGLMAVLAVTLRGALPSRPPPATLPYGRLLRSTAGLLRRHGVLRRRALYQSLMFGGFSAFWTTVSYVLTGPPFHYSQIGVALFALAGAGGAAVAPLAGHWADHGLTRPMTAAAFATGALAFVLAGLGRHEILLLAPAAVLIDMAVQTSLVLGQHTVYQLAPTARARLNSAYIAVFFVGGALGSQLGSVAYHLGGWDALTGFGAGLLALGLLLQAPALLPRGKHAENAENAENTEDPENTADGVSARRPRRDARRP
ncbi:MFS transporter [Streptomyces sp. NPDC088732]|uniref:MFS transporter n=1 Tax=Streptomyces sp. NPDC088732 TaxID=3365879 RepID=UPI00380CFC2B